MAQPTSILSQTMRSISLTKIRELEKRRGRYESQKNKVLAAAEKHPDNIRERITELLSGVKSLHLEDWAGDPSFNNIDLWLQQSKYDASVPYQLLQSYETVLRSKLDVQSRRLDLGRLWSRLVTEWMDSTTPMAETPSSDDGPSDKDRQEERLKALCERFEKVVFTPLETDEAKIERYMQDLFNGDEGGKALELVRSRVGRSEKSLLNGESPFNRGSLRWCINGLLAEDLLSDEKQDVLRGFLKSPAVLDEIADVLNMRFADFDNWSWEAGEGGIPVLPRPQLNGKYRIWMDEDVLQAIFIHYIGIKNCVALRNILTSFLVPHAGVWDWSAGKTMPQVDRQRYQYFTGTKLEYDWSLEKIRSNFYRNDFLLAQLPATVTTIGGSQAYNNDGEDQGDDNDEEERRNKRPNPKNPNIKQKLLRTLATEAIVHRTLYGESAVVQSDLQWYATGLSHTTIFAVMRFLGFSERLISFYRKLLEAPLNLVSTPGASPTGEPRIRRRGVPMAHAPEKFAGEMILFVMDLAVNKATGMLIYRLHDDLFLCGAPRRCAQAWKEMEEFANVMGVEFNKHKTGSAYLTKTGGDRDAEIEAALPEGVVRIGHLLLDQDSGDWILDQDQINEHVAQLQKQLAACNGVLDWVKTWNSCISRFFSHTLGEPANCFGLKHVESVLQVYQRIQRVLFGPPSPSPEDDGDQSTSEVNVVTYLKSKILERFGVSDISDAFVFLPEQNGGLGVKNPFLPYLSCRREFLQQPSHSSPDKIMQKFLADERGEYERLCKVFDKLDTTEDRLKRLRHLYPDNVWFEYARLSLGDVLVPGENKDFLTFEEYTRHCESTSYLLSATYKSLLDVPHVKGVEEGKHVEWIQPSTSVPWSEAKEMQIKWVMKLYQEELDERWGGSKLVDENYLPLGLLSMMRRKAVRWTMVL